MKHWPADKVERRKVADLTPYARNSRTHSDEQVAQIAASIKEWGWTVPVLIEPDGGIIAGHGRVMAAQRLGIAEVPCMVAEGWSEAQKRAYIIADNKLALNAGWDDEMLRAELRSIMRQYKLRPVSNGWQSANSYNSSVEPEPVAAHNDVYHVGFVDEGDASVVVGHEALRLASLSRPSAWRLFSPWTRGMLNVTGYAAEYGDACIEALLGDVQRILTHAISSAPSKASGPADAADDAGLGIPTSEYGDYAVLLLVPDSFSRSDLRALGHVLLRYMGFSALHVQTEGLCATFGAGLSAACVVDVGATSIGISCVEEGLVLPETRVALSYGGQDMSRFFGDVLRGSSFPYTDLQEARLADVQLLQDLKERFVTLQPSQVGLNLYDFMVRLPGETARKYALRLYDEPILAGLMLFHPDVAAPPPMPRRPLTCAQPAPAEEADEPEPTAVLAAANASLGGDEAVELCASAVLDMAPTLAMLGCVSRRLSPQVAALAHRAMMDGTIVAAAIAIFICFAATGPISRVLGDVGMAIVVRVLGLILCALAIQFILLGLGEAIPGMISGAVTTPYPAIK